jgi:hypothetical protein
MDHLLFGHFFFPFGLCRTIRSMTTGSIKGREPSFHVTRVRVSREAIDVFSMF